MSRPNLSKTLSSEEFKNYYYLREELVNFCRDEGIPTSGRKQELTERVAHYLDTGEVVLSKENTVNRRYKPYSEELTLDTPIESNFVCSEIHREFFKQYIGESFTFKVPFQRWLKENTGKTYRDAIEAYYQILEAKKTEKPEIGKQFEYNTYIRDFFTDNTGRSLAEAIECWKYKKSQPGHNRYEKSDLIAIEAKNLE